MILFKIFKPFCLLLTFQNTVDFCIWSMYELTLPTHCFSSRTFYLFIYLFLIFLVFYIDSPALYEEDRYSSFLTIYIFHFLLSYYISFFNIMWKTVFREDFPDLFLVLRGEKFNFPS